MSLSVAILDPVVAGDDWTFIWDITGDLSTWSLTGLKVTIRDGFTNDSADLAHSTGGGTIVTTGSSPLDVPATDFTAGVFSAYIAKANTSPFDPGSERTRTVYLSARTTIDGRLTTFIPASPLIVNSTIN